MVQALAEQADLSHADGRAQFAELARPLVTKVAPGVYRDLLIDRLSASIKLPTARLNQIWFNEEVGPQGEHVAGGRFPIGGPAFPRVAQGRARDGGGNKGLITKAVKHLVHFPGIATRISGAQLTRLESNDDAGSRFLFELIDQLQQEPAAHTAQLLERWRERPEVKRMQDLAAEEMATGVDENGAAQELVTAIDRLSMEPTLRRHDELIAKGDLTEDERAELRELTAALNAAKSSGSRAAGGV
jgi:DNA primase